MNIDTYWTPTVFQACHTLAVIESPLSPARQIWLSSFAMWGGWCSLRLHRSPQVTQLGSKKGNAAQAQSICHPCLCTHRFNTRAPGGTTTAASSPHILGAFLPRRWASTSEPPWNVCLPALQIPTEQVLDFLLRSKVPLFLCYRFVGLWISPKCPVLSWRAWVQGETLEVSPALWPMPGSAQDIPSACVSLNMGVQWTVQSSATSFG